MLCSLSISVVLSIKLRINYFTCHDGYQVQVQRKIQVTALTEMTISVSAIDFSVLY